MNRRKRVEKEKMWDTVYKKDRTYNKTLYRIIKNKV